MFIAFRLWTFERKQGAIQKHRANHLELMHQLQYVIAYLYLALHLLLRKQVSKDSELK